MFETSARSNHPRCENKSPNAFWNAGRGGQHPLQNNLLDRAPTELVGHDDKTVCVRRSTATTT